MKKIAFLLALCLMLAASTALAAGNVTIAVQGQNGFEDYISGMFVWGDRLLLASWNRLYAWQGGDGGLVEVEGYSELTSRMDQNTVYAEDGSHTVNLGETVIELDEDEDIYLEGALIVAGDRLFRAANIYDGDGNNRSCFIELKIAQDGALSFGAVVDLGDLLVIDYGDGYTGIRDLQTPCFSGGIVYALSYGEYGRELVALDIDNADLEVLDLDIGDAQIQSLSPFTEGKLLMVSSDYMQDPVVTELLVYDIESGAIDSLGELPRDGWNVPCAIAYDAESSRLIYTLGGSVWRMTVSEDGIGEPEEFGDMPLEIYSDSSAVLLDGLYIVSSYEGVVGRDIHLDQLPEQRLHIDNSGYLEPVRKAYYPFTDAHPEYMVSISTGSDQDAVLLDMMNRSSDVDIYVMSVQEEAFASLMSRGYLAELGGSETLTQAVAQMYPSMQEAVMKDGELYAMPMNIYMDCTALNAALLTEKLGYAQEDLPETWAELFALFADLADSGKLEEYPEVSLISPGYTIDNARYMLFIQMLYDYFLWLDVDEANLMRGSEVLIANCEAFEQIDWSGSGMPEEYEEDGIWEYNPENILFETTSLAPQYYAEEAMMPLALSVEEGAPRMIGGNMTVAFVNPFSEHREAAIEFLEMAWGLADQAARIALMPGENEPVENKYYEENLRDYDDFIAGLQKQLEEAEDEETRDVLMQQLEDMQTWRAEYVEEGRYDISAEDIERYRQYATFCAVRHSNPWGDDTYSRISQYLDGAISAQQLAAELEKTLQMKRLEGN